MLQHSIEEHLADGVALEDAVTITDAHLVIAAGLIGGFQRVHVDDSYARSIGLRGRILHGSITAAIMSTVVGRRLPTGGWVVVSQSTRYRQPVYPRDTLHTRWVLDSAACTSTSAGRLVALRGECRREDTTLVADGQMQLLCRASGTPG